MLQAIAAAGERNAVASRCRRLRLVLRIRSGASGDNRVGYLDSVARIYRIRRTAGEVFSAALMTLRCIWAAFRLTPRGCAARSAAAWREFRVPAWPR